MTEEHPPAKEKKECETPNVWHMRKSGTKYAVESSMKLFT